MTSVPVLVDNRLTAARYAIPIAGEWVETDGLDLRRIATPAEIRERNAVALVDSLIASLLLETHAIVTDHAVASRRASMLTMVSHTRPDDVDNVVVSTPDVSVSGRAVAEATLPRFYGITTTGWVTERRKVDASTVLITEGAEALIPVDDPDAYQEDLGRAWFLMTDTPYVSHVCVAPRALLTRNPASVVEAVGRLEAVRAAGEERARELRRNISRDHDIDREVVADTLADQTYRLNDPERSGLLALWRATGVSIPGDTRNLFVTLS